MAKKKSSFVCTECGETFLKWVGRCTSCGAYNTIKEFRESVSAKHTDRYTGFLPDTESAGVVRKLSEYTAGAVSRISTGFPEVDMVLGGGVVPGEVCLIGGSPGIGKSTLLLQIAAYLSQHVGSVLYVSGEESLEQISLRARRIGCIDADIQAVAETAMEKISDHMGRMTPAFVVIDSIQTLHTSYIDSSPGSISQVRESTALIAKLAKQLNIPVFIIGHVTKNGSLSGPRVLEHMVDAVLHFEGDSNYSYRFLRGLKNRFGPAGEVALLDMKHSGLHELSQGARFLLNSASLEKPGTAVVPLLEGSRVLMVEVQALVTQSHFGLPQRVAAGINQKKLALIVAVLEKYANISLGGYDIFINITGGFRVHEPAVDLAIAAAIVSSFRNISLGRGTSFTGELGLSGELRPVADMEKRIREAGTLGFSRLVCPPLGECSAPKGDISLVICEDIAGMIEQLL
ncbi:DNA repair protein RadA [Chitinivibrio alkaliphilus]|uniref:DNA repair protein RadA n=1 Tax=Chitinivibrio alkaliphilus ACht1 TaxID=1313304 RepID=U7D8K3_9BACT|nr:DNA repair protein RadA [Chitinivibrio alkaliphilus]ERP31417.1 DNA repair protein RadA [Chitinivibrio alkaliphilus ACht1]